MRAFNFCCVILFFKNMHKFLIHTNNNNINLLCSRCVILSDETLYIY